MGKKKKSGVIIISTFPTEESLREIARDLIVDKKICACVNYAKIRSLYFWRNKLEDHVEFLTLFKTTNQRSEELKAEIKKRHPYEIPEVVELKMNDVSETYVAWMAQSTNSVN
ncbi:MAG: divalent-cation tolerance protein CutA [Candidatus Nitrosopolaris sp.]